ncbi:MAG: GAF domain-containing protein [Anaerolineales bacterium]|jgi:PAS domain S-box-containing protein|nr:GAF domain-containing protein [Anaerolineales bacterium]
MVANLLAFHLFLTAFLFLVVGGYVLDRRQASAAAIPFWIAMFLLAIFSMLAGLDVLIAPLESKILLMRLRLSILPFAVVAILVATIENAQRASLINKSRIGLLCVIPGLNLLFVWLPALSDSVRSNYKIIKSADFLSTLRYDNGPWFWVLLSYSILLALALFGIQFVTLLNSKGIYFKQTLLLSIGQIVPAVLIALLATGRLLFNGYNYGPHVLMLTALLNGWALYRYQWKLTAPIARDIALDLMNEIMLVANESGNLSDANASARQTLAISDQDMGKSLSHFIPGWDEIRAEAGSRESLRREIGLTRQNIKKMYELTVNPARSADPQNITAYVLIMREVTEQIRQKEQVQNLTRAVSQSPNSVLITDPNGIIEYVNPSFTRLTGYSPEEAIGKKTSLLKSGLTPEKVYQEMWQTIKAGRLWKEDMLNRRKDGEVYWEETLIAPLFDQYGQIVNYISIKEDVSARKEIDEILHRRLDELMMVNTISMAAASQLDLGSLVSLVGQQLEQSFNVRSVLIALHSNGAEYIEVPYWTIDRKRVSPPPLQYGEGLVSHILKTRQPLLISSDFRATAPKFGHKAIFAEKYGYPKTWLGVPVISGQQTVGVISLQNYTDEFAYSDDDVRLLNTIAASIGVAIDNARLFRATQEEIEERIRAEQESRERAVQMSVLYEIGHSLTKEIELEAVLNSLMEKCKQIAPIDVFAVGLHDQEAKQVKFIKFNDRGEEKENLVLDETSEEYILNEAIQRGVTIHLSNCGKESKYQGHPLHNNSQPVQSCLAIPLFHGNEVTGILAVQSYQPKAFSPEQIQTLEIVASQAAIAIDNARLYDVARRRADEMTLLYEASLELSANLDTDQVLRNLLEKCRQFLAMDSFYVSIYDEANHLIYYPLFYDRGDFTTLPARDLRVSPGLTGEVIMSAKTLYLPDTNDPQIIAQYQIIHIGGTPTRSFFGSADDRANESGGRHFDPILPAQSLQSGSDQADRNHCPPGGDCG